MFFAEKQFKNDPRRCKTCKAQRLRATAALAKGDPTKLTVSTVQTEVCCASCGILTSVPFKPVRNLPVFCRACFSAGRQSAQTSAPSGPRESASA
jgi:CxxC-x17-CxxC domain-containing protein